MRRAERTATVDAPPSEVYAFLSDIRNLPRWQSGVERADLTSDGAVAIGSTALVERRVLGQEVRADLRVVALEPERRIVLETDAGGLHVEASVGLAPAGDGQTQVTFGMAMEATSFFMRPAEPMVAAAAENDIADSLQRLTSVFRRSS